MKKRVLSLLLALVMVVSLMPGAWAEETEASAAQTAYSATGKYLSEQAAATAAVYGSEWLVLDAARAGLTVPEGYYTGYLSAVESKVQTTINAAEQLKSATDSEKLILALTAIGADVTDVAGHNLLVGLADKSYAAKAINSAVYALLAFDSGSYEIPAAPAGKTQVTRENLVQYILDKELAGGGWAYSGTIADPDMTAMAMQALAPYVSTNADVRAAVDSAVAVLSARQKENGGYVSWGAESSESIAQVVIALCTLGIDPATDSRFIKGETSVLDALCAYAVTGGGFAHTHESDGSNKYNATATVQGYLALSAYMRFLHGQTGVYQMTDVDQAQLGKLTSDLPHTYTNSRDAICNLCGYERDVSVPEDALTGTVTVSISNAGTLVLGHKAITVTDLNGDGKLDVDETLYAAHETAYSGGAETGYDAAYTQYGLSITKLWGDESGAYGYWLNDVSCWSLEDEVKTGDSLVAFVYADSTYWSDAYAKMTPGAATCVEGGSVTVDVQQAGYDANWNTVFSACEDYTLAVLDSNMNPVTSGWSVQGSTVTFAKAGSYLLVAAKEDRSIVPAVCAVTVTAPAAPAAPTTLAAQSTPETGDSGVTLYIALAVLALCGSAIVLKKRKKA